MSDVPHDLSCDLVVIGSGPAGQKAAIAAAKRVAVIDRQAMLGGVSLHTGTIPSKTLREPILYLTGFRQRRFHGRDHTLKDDISVSDLSFRVHEVKARELEVVRAQLKRNHVTVIEGAARFADPHTLELAGSGGVSRVRGDFVLIACGTRPARDAAIAVDGASVFDGDQLVNLTRLPKELLVVGAGVIGLEYASMAAALGIAVTVVDQRPTVLDFVDREIVDALLYFMRRAGAVFRLGEKVVSVGRDERGRVAARLESGKEIHAEGLLHTVGRQTNADRLNLAAAGLSADARGRLAVNGSYQTEDPHIDAAGDVVGFPALASTSMEQGRLASAHMVGSPEPSRPTMLPYGIYTIPEISMVGKTERERADPRRPGGPRLRRHGRHLHDTTFNYPTLAEAYEVAGLDGLNKVA